MPIKICLLIVLLTILMNPVYSQSSEDIRKIKSEYELYVSEGGKESDFFIRKISEVIRENKKLKSENEILREEVEALKKLNKKSRRRQLENLKSKILIIESLINDFDYKYKTLISNIEDINSALQKKIDHQYLSDAMQSLKKDLEQIINIRFSEKISTSNKVEFGHWSPTKNLDSPRPNTQYKIILDSEKQNTNSKLLSMTKDSKGVFVHRSGYYHIIGRTITTIPSGGFYYFQLYNGDLLLQTDQYFSRPQDISTGSISYIGFFEKGSEINLRVKHNGKASTAYYGRDNTQLMIISIGQN